VIDAETLHVNHTRCATFTSGGISLEPLDVTDAPLGGSA
jgi:hypothetical protein